MKKLIRVGLVLMLIGIVSSVVLVSAFKIDMNNILSIGNRSPFINIGNEKNDKTIYEEYDSFSNLSVDVDLGEVIIEEGEKFTVKIDYCSKCKYSFEVKKEGNTLDIVGSKKGNWVFNMNNSSPVIIVTIPAGNSINDLDVDSDLGIVKITGLNINKLELEASMGDVVVNNNIINEASIDAKMGSVKAASDINEVDISVSMGELVFKGKTSKIDVSNSMGATTLEIKGIKDDYKIKVKSSMGSINVDGQKDEGINNSLELNQDKNLDNSIDVDNSMGEVDIRFVQ